MYGFALRIAMQKQKRHTYTYVSIAQTVYTVQQQYQQVKDVLRFAVLKRKWRSGTSRWLQHIVPFGPVLAVLVRVRRGHGLLACG